MRHLKAANLPINGPEALFITHLHSDHTLGYADLILTSWVMRRRAPFRVFGPPGLQRMTNHLLAAYSEDIRVRTNGLEHEVAGGYRVSVHEIRTGVVYEKDGVRVTAIAVQHGAWRNAFGYRIDTADRSIVISGDTRPSEALVKAARGVDILIHEVYSASRLAPEDRPGGKDWPRYCREYHTSDVELGHLAERIQPKLLILDHLIRMGASDDELLAAVRAGGHEIVGAGIIVGSTVDPQTIKGDHIRAHAEEGRLFRVVIENTLKTSRLKSSVTREKDSIGEGRKMLGISEQKLRTELAKMGKAVEGSWRAEEKAATLAALMALADWSRSRNWWLKEL